jgi:Flp pilus assembly secretin CpaC
MIADRLKRPASTQLWQALAVAIAGTMVALALLSPARAQGTMPPARELVLEIRKGQLIRLERPAAAVFVADPEVADVQAHSPTLVYVFGRRSGTTTLFAVDANEDVLLRRNVVVEHHLSGLQRIWRQSSPQCVKNRLENQWFRSLLLTRSFSDAPVSHHRVVGANVHSTGVQVVVLEPRERQIQSVRLFWRVLVVTFT